MIQSGDVLVICDALQKLDAPEFATIMHNFPITFHEPYYNHYISDDLAEKISKAGFIDLEIQQHFASKYWIAQKPV